MGNITIHLYSLIRLRNLLTARNSIYVQVYKRCTKIVLIVTEKILFICFVQNIPPISAYTNQNSEKGAKLAFSINDIVQEWRVGVSNYHQSDELHTTHKNKDKLSIKQRRKERQEKQTNIRTGLTEIKTKKETDGKQTRREQEHT